MIYKRGSIKQKKTFALPRQWFGNAKNPFPTMCVLCAAMYRKVSQSLSGSASHSFSKIHDLLALLDFAVDIDTELEILRDDLNFLSPFAVEFRYPGETATVEESKDAVKVMRRVRRTLRTKLNLGDA